MAKNLDLGPILAHLPQIGLINISYKDRKFNQHNRKNAERKL